MNETLKTIKNRRAIREYHPQQIPQPALQEILGAALYAPNAMNKQSWHFTVIQDQGILDTMSTLIVENIIQFNNTALIKTVTSPHYHPFYHAPTVILISGNKASEFIQIEAGTAAQNITLAAESLDIGSCITTMPAFAFMSKDGYKLKEQLGIPEGYTYICSIVLGYKAGKVPPIPPRNTDVINYI